MARVPAKIIRKLETALSRAKFERACFGMPHDIVVMNGKKTDKDTFIKEETSIYRETWLIPELEAILEWAKGA